MNSATFAGTAATKDTMAPANPSSAVVAMTEDGASSIEVKPERRADYTDEIDRLHDDLVWTHPGVSTYYRTRGGKVRSPMPFRLVDYWARTHDADLDDFIVDG